jgi:hypothetical protein
MRHTAHLVAASLLAFSLVAPAWVDAGPTSRSGLPDAGAPAEGPRACGVDGTPDCVLGTGVEFYDDRTLFLAAIASGYYEEDFASVPVGPAGPLLSFSGNGFSYDITAVGGGTNNLFNDPGVISTDSAVDRIRVTFTGAPVRAVGGNFWASDIAFNPTGGEIVLGLDDGSTESYSPSSPSSFGGFTSAVPIVFLEVDAPDVPGNQWATMDNLIVGTLPPALSLDPTDVDFGSQLVGSSSGPQAVEIENTGGDDLEIGALALSGAHAGDFSITADGCSNETLAPGATCSFSVDFSPSATGARTAQVDVPSNAPSSPDALPLAGIGIEGALTATPGAIDFGNVPVGTGSAPIAVTVENTGSAPVAIGNLGISGTHASDFAISADTCSMAVLGPAETCGFSATMSPSAAGARSAQVEIPSDAPSSPVIVPLTGTGTQPALGLAPATLDFGSLNPGQTATLTTTVSNTGNGDLDISAISAPGGAFALVGGTCLPPPTSVPPSGSCTITVEFAPTAVGSFSGSITITSNAPSSPDTVTLLGTAVSPLPPPRQIPVGGPWGLVLLAGLLGVIGLLATRASRRAHPR